jgi:predicted nuclease of predicted toxin-antitoxin system
MKALLDMPVSAALLDVLRKHGHEGIHAYHRGLDRASDIELLELARREERIVITADLDFPRLLVLSSAEGPGVILFRGGNYSDAEMCDLLDRVLNQVSPQMLENSICVVDKKRIRTTRLPLYGAKPSSDQVQPL